MHYKKKLYNVIGTVNLLDNPEEHVLYSSMYLPKKTWLRPKNMFLENIESGKRFTCITNHLNVGNLQEIENYYQALDDLNFDGDKEETINLYLDRNMQPDKIQMNNDVYNFMKYIYPTFGYLKCIGKATHTENENTYFIFKKDSKLVGIKYEIITNKKE